MKLEQILLARAVLGKILNESHPGARLGFKLALFQKALEPYFDGYIQARRELLKCYAKPGDAPDTFNFIRDDGERDTDAIDRFNQEHDDLVQAEIEIAFKLTLDEVDKLGLALTPAELLSIEWMIDSMEIVATK